MKKVILTGIVVGLLSGCAIDPNAGPNQVGGALVGAAVGAAAGSLVGSGSGNTAAIAAGALIGAGVGSNVGRHMDQNDRRYMYRSLNNAPDYRTTTWVNPNSNVHYEVTPTKTYYDFDRYNGAPCREFSQTAIIGGKRQTVYGTACRQNDGSWKIMQ